MLRPSTYTAAQIAQVVILDSFVSGLSVYLEHAEDTTDATPISEAALRRILGLDGVDDYAGQPRDDRDDDESQWRGYLDRVASRLREHRLACFAPLA